MTMDRRGCWPPRSRTKDKARVIAATQTGNRRGALQGGGGVEEKGAISQAKLLLGCRRENITAITAPGRRGGKESEVVEEQKAAGRRREVPNKSSIISVTKHVRSHKQIE